MASDRRKILVTSALPYANGPIHLGHLLEVVQADIWTRFQRLRGHDAYYVCADDAHGTPIMLSAEKEGIAPEQLIDKMRASHTSDFEGFHVAFDHYHSTHSEENKALAEHIYLALKESGHIKQRTIEQLFDPEKNIFLPDRFVRGQCPKCKAEDQYGDSCDVCGATYDPTDLINPVSALTGATPVMKESEHFFFDLPAFEASLKEWITTGHLQEEIAHKLNEWFDAGLKEWDISRDAPYFGFEIPGEQGKYFYVWLDAPIGYLASFKAFTDSRPTLNFEDFWSKGSTAEVYHIIGKDIVYFHALFWPAMLEGAGFRKPNAIFTHGFVTVNGQKMSKSKGTFIKAETYLNHLNPEHLRYYFAAKLSHKITDIDLSFDDFLNRVNSDLVGKLVNIASRCAGFVHKNFEGRLSDDCIDSALYEKLIQQKETIASHYEARDFHMAMRAIMELADEANQFINDKAPWALLKKGGHEAEVHGIVSLGINLFRVLVGYLKPVLPKLTEAVEDFLQIPPMSWDSQEKPLLSHTIKAYTPLMVRVTDKDIAAMQKEALESLPKPPSQQPGKQKNMSIPDLKPEISIDDFAKIDLRVAKIIEAEPVEGADKLLKLTLDIGLEATKTVFAGLKKAYSAEDLVGKHTAFVANLTPRKMRFGLSEGMVLAAGPGGDELWILEPHEGAQPGMAIK